MYKNNLLTVINYLEGKLDIYDGQHEAVINTWNNAWDEMAFTGCNPQTVDGIKKYIREQL